MTKFIFFIFVFLFLFTNSLYSQEFKEFTHPVADIEFLSSTYLGNENRNYYGNTAPAKLDVLWKFMLGSGKTIDPYSKGALKTMYGAGWTGQGATIRHDSSFFIIQPSFSHKLFKINAKTGEKVWEYSFNDILKGSPTLWHNNYSWDKNRFLIIQGSRRGSDIKISDPYAFSLRAIDFITGKPVWFYNVKRSLSFSRDVDASPLVIHDTLYAPLENGYLLIADPRPDCTVKKDAKLPQPDVFSLIKTYTNEDAINHRNNVVLEASPTAFGDYLYMASGTGWLYGYNKVSDSIDWKFHTGADMDGTPVVTRDSSLLITLEKQYIPGQGGVFKIDPEQHPDSCVLWYFPVPDTNFVVWEGGIIGSAAVNDHYMSKNDQHLAAVVSLDGYVYILNHEFTSGDSVFGPERLNKYPAPELVYKHYVGPSISTPVFTDNKLIVAGYLGLYLFSYDDNCLFTLEDKFDGGFESTPVLLNGKVYIASRNGYLYCLGEKHAGK
ncbi:MAG: PQQ-binding-like beta-propeller repeat protein [Bacteroidales bacterium]